ncbi:MAG: ribosome maturation factor RimP [Candidatus Omnitrophota bacterium]
MDKHEKIDKLKKLIQDYLESRRLEFVDLIYHYEGRDLFLRILVDTPGDNICLDECARLNREIGAILDGQEMLNQRYILEVSSPGIDRPITTKKDFLRCRNRKVKFFLKEMVNGKLEWDGIISKVEGDSVFADIKGEILEIPINKVNKVKQLLTTL